MYFLDEKPLNGHLRTEGLEKNSMEKGIENEDHPATCSAVDVIAGCTVGDISDCLL